MNPKTASYLKGLQVREQRLVPECERLKAELSESSKRYQAAKADLDKVRGEIQTLTAKPVEPIVSEHAMLRYLERVKGVDLQALTNEILTEERRQYIAELKTCSIRCDGYVLVVKSGTVVSVTEEAPPKVS